MYEIRIKYWFRLKNSWNSSAKFILSKYLKFFQKKKLKKKFSADLLGHRQWKTETLVFYWSWLRTSAEHVLEFNEFLIFYICKQFGTYVVFLRIVFIFSCLWDWEYPIILGILLFIYCLFIYFDLLLVHFKICFWFNYLVTQMVVCTL